MDSKMTEAEDWKRQMMSLEDDNFNLYKRLQEAYYEIAKLEASLANSRTSINLLKAAQQEEVDF